MTAALSGSAQAPSAQVDWHGVVQIPQ